MMKFVASEIIRELQCHVEVDLLSSRYISYRSSRILLMTHNSLSSMRDLTDWRLLLRMIFEIFLAFSWLTPSLNVASK